MRYRIDIEHVCQGGAVLSATEVRRPVLSYTRMEIYRLFTKEQLDRIREDDPEKLDLLFMVPEPITSELFEDYVGRLLNSGLLSQSEHDLIVNGES